MLGRTSDGRGRAHGKQIIVAHRADIIRSQGEECLRPAGRSDELDLKRLRPVEMRHRAQITRTKPRLREIPEEDNRLEFAAARSHGIRLGRR